MIKLLDILVAILNIRLYLFIFKKKNINDKTIFQRIKKY